MSLSIPLVDSSMSAIFAVPQSSWQAVDAETSSVAGYNIDPIEPGTIQYASVSWLTYIRPGLRQLSLSLGNFSGTAIQLLQQLQTLIAGLAPNAPLPDDIKAKASGLLQQLANGMLGLRQNSQDLLAAVTDFSAIVKEDDREMRAAGADNPEWATFFASTAAVENACDALHGAWQAITEDLENAATKPIPLTMEILTSLGVKSAISAWTNLGAEARTFAAQQPHRLMAQAAPSTTSYSLAPGDLATPGTSGGPAFVMSRTEWIAIQNYVNDGLSLPTTVDEFRNALGSGAPSDLSDFTRLVTAYAAIGQHCMTWLNATFPTTVSLASDIYNYGSNIVPVYYPAIVTEANILVNDPDNVPAQQALTAILNALQATVDKYHDNATAAADAVSTFVNQMKADENTLTDPVSGLQTYYSDKYGKTSTEVASLTGQIAAWRQSLEGDEAAYRHDVIVASTTPTYAWIPFVGTISAAVVAGEYGHKAVQALTDIQTDKNKIEELTAERQADANLITAINLATTGITGITAALQTALPAVEKVKGVWKAISDDIGDITKLIQTSIRDVPLIIVNLGVDSVITAWADVADAANSYRVHAYVVNSGGPMQSMQAWRVKTLMASRPAA